MPLFSGSPVLDLVELGARYVLRDRSCKRGYNRVLSADADADADADAGTGADADADADADAGTGTGTGAGAGADTGAPLWSSP